MLLVAFDEHLQLTEGLSLVPDLIDNAVDSCQIGRMLSVGEYFLLCNVLVDLVEVTYLEQLEEEVRVDLRPHEDSHQLGVVA